MEMRAEKLLKDSRQYFAFNIWSAESAKAVIDGCAECGIDAFLQTSMKAYDHIDKKQLCRFVRDYSKEKGITAILQLDHCRDVEKIKEAIDCGYDSVMIDASEKPLAENIAITNIVTGLAHECGAAVEAEVGQIKQNDGVADIEDVKQFVDETDIDLLAVAIGTAHGLYKGEPKLSYELLDDVTAFCQVPLVVHGGTGLSDETFLRLLSYKRIKKINISTEVKLSYRRAILECVEKNEFELIGFDPVKISSAVHDEIKNMVIRKQRILEEAAD